jgi:hypothetical protein
MGASAFAARIRRPCSLPLFRRRQFIELMPAQEASGSVVSHILRKGIAGPKNKGFCNAGNRACGCDPENIAVRRVVMMP